MQDILQRLQLFEEKVIQLAQKVEYLRKENMMLIEENVKLKQQTEKVITGSIAQGQREKEAVRQEVKSVEEKEQIRNQLESYVIQIDKCIELINNL